MDNRFFGAIEGRLIVSCQALPDEPLHSSHIMSRMAYAAMLGGAAGIRANSVEDITEIRKAVNLPIIGLIKRVFDNSPVYITPTMEDVDALAAIGVEVIAIDATARPRPTGTTISEDFPLIRQKYPDQLFMADCSTVEDALRAVELGFDCVGTTLCGYTDETKHIKIPSFELLAELGTKIHIPVIAEGGIWSPAELKKAISIPGIHAAVVGSAITRPMEITRKYVAAIS